MTKLIDADELNKKLHGRGFYSPKDDSEHGVNFGLQIAQQIIDAMPTIEIPHGEWVEVPNYKGFYVCSKCLERLDGDFERFNGWNMKKDNFCSVCGSDNRKMGDPDV